MTAYQDARTICVEFDGIDILHSVWARYLGTHRMLALECIIYIDFSICPAGAEDVLLLESVD